MNWLIISIVPPVIWAVGNHIDKYLLNRFFKNSSGASLMILTAFATLIVCIPILIFKGSEINLSLKQAIILASLGFASMCGGIAYVLALQKDDPSVVIPLFQIIPVFNYFLGLIFLKEHLSTIQILGSLTIILGALSLTIEQEGEKFKLKKEVIYLMLITCVISAFYDLIFKSVAIQSTLWGSIFWTYIGYMIFGFLSLVFVKKWRDEIFKLYKESTGILIGLNLFNEIASIVAGMIFKYALLLMPIALVSVVSNGLQPFFVLIFGIIITLIWPTLAHEKLGKRDLIPKIISIVIIFVGTFLLNK